MKPNLSRNAAIDVLRGVAILLVLILHFHLAYDLVHSFFGDCLSQDFLHRLVRNGNYGVVMFFVISGFLITSTTINRFSELKFVSLSSFYSFRVARILPNLVLMVTIVVLLAVAGLKIFANDHSSPTMFVTVLSILTFTHNLLMEKFGYFNYCLNILWSLSVEEAFYLTFPILCLLLRNKKWLLLAWCLLLFVSPLYRNFHKSDSDDIYGLYDYLACCDGLAMGCVIGLMKPEIRLPDRIKKLWALPASAIAVIYFYQGIWSNLVFGVSGIVLATGLLLFLVDEDHKISRFVAPLGWLGKYSYELYLFHIIILALMRTIIPRSDTSYAEKPILFFTFVLISFFFSFLISKFYSEPLNKKIRKCFGAQSSRNQSLAIQFAALMDQSKFYEAGHLMAESCRYIFQGKTIVGVPEIIQTYVANHESANQRLDEIQYFSEVVPLGPGKFKLKYLDRIRKGQSWLEHRCEQVIVLRHQKITEIEHFDLPGESERLKEWFKSVGIARLPSGHVN